MPVPSTIDDLSTTAGNNSPAGSDPVGNTLDDYLRAYASFIAQLRDEKRFLPGRNIVINGAINYDQQNSGASVTHTTTGALSYAVDQFAILASQASKLATQQVSDAPAGFSKSLKVTVVSAVTSAAADYFQLVQPIEGQNLAELQWGVAAASAVTLQFRIKSSLTGTFAGCIRNGSTSNRTYPFNYTVSVAGTFTTVTVTIPGDVTGSWAKDTTRAFDIVWDLGSGSNFNGTAASWQAGNFTRTSGSVSLVANAGATWQITGVKLEAGTVATPWSAHWGVWGGEDQAVARYAEAGQSVGIVQPTADGGGTYRSYCQVKFKSTKRASPTILVSAAVSGTNGKATSNYYASVYGGSQADSTGAAAAVNITTESCIIFSVNSTNGKYDAANWFATARL